MHSSTRRSARLQRLLYGGALVALPLAGTLFITSQVSADPSPTPVCDTLVAGEASGWCALTASGKLPSDSRAQGQVSISNDGTTFTVTTQDNGQGGTILGAAPYESQACIYPPPEAPREARLDDPAKCGAVGGTLYTWSNVNSSGPLAVPSSLVGGNYYIYVAAHPDAKNQHGTAYHWTWGAGAPTSVPVGAIGGIGAAGLLGAGFGLVQWRRKRRISTTA